MRQYFLKLLNIFSILWIPIVVPLSLLLEVYKKLFRCKSIKSIDGDIAVVTGGGGGLGRAISMELAKHGCHVAVVDVNYEEAQKTVQLINENYKVYTKAYKVDITNYDEIVELNKNITSDLGKATILINNAGILYFSDILEPEPSEVQRMINVNFTSHFWTNRVFLENMKELGKGHIVAISSVAGLNPLPFFSVYAGTKHAVRGLMRTLRIELKMDANCSGIRTTIVYPTPLDTNSVALDIIRKLKLNRLFGVQTGDAMAKRIIQGMLRNEVEITRPDERLFFIKCTEFWPTELYDWVTANIFFGHLKK
ncbi:estradiol 17-beta-dehydrogenase 11-like [Teleopsis dalmanni]|uniref:estradiol 17-beta-dehydrogenase 11-like n=1 Tax=Teleopsis dalmanni TaxID=139649 RepID=UPI0018CF795D|nr:estradiol 17-beta-dehydrogenase 11-like [Teleopsis dalmanni]XP_037946063.1 estradiol 17-beta-dehydrogenase 11-like [Teleopsis dalmanni]